MAADLIAPMAVLPLTNGATVVAEALDPTTFATVSGVVIEQFTMYAVDNSGSSTEDDTPLTALLLNSNTG